MSSAINYAKVVGIESIVGAAVFTVLYLPLFIWFARKSFVHPTHVHYTLTLFCISKSKQKNLIVFSSLFFPLVFFLYSPGRSLCHAHRFGSLGVNSREPECGYCGWSTFQYWLFRFDIFCVQPCLGSVRTLFFYVLECPFVLLICCFKVFFSPILHHRKILYWELLRTEGCSVWQS